MFNATRKAEVLDKFGVWAPSIMKKWSMNLLKYLFAAVLVVALITKMTQINASTPLEWNDEDYNIAHRF